MAIFLNFCLNVRVHVQKIRRDTLADHAELWLHHVRMNIDTCDLVLIIVPRTYLKSHRKDYDCNILSSCDPSTSLIWWYVLRIIAVAGKHSCSGDCTICKRFPHPLWVYRLVSLLWLKISATDWNPVRVWSYSFVEHVNVGQSLMHLKRSRIQRKEYYVERMDEIKRRTLRRNKTEQEN